jgi:amidase
VVGPLARSADDLEIALDLLAGPEASETGLRYRLPKPRASKLKDLRVAVWAEDEATHTDAETTSALHGLARFLEREGAAVSLAARPAIEPRVAFEVYLQLLSAATNSRAPAEQLARLKESAASLAPDDRSARAVHLRAADLPHREWIVLNERRMRMRRAWGAFFQDWDVLLCPVLGVPPQLKMEDRPIHELQTTVNNVTVPWGELLFWPGVVGGVHLPASVAPLGRTPGGLPIGVQIVGPLYGDRTTIAVAQMLEEGWRKFEAPAGWA